MTHDDRIKEFERKANADKRDCFERWLDDPMVRMGMSMIPAGERADALRMLLQSAFEAGFGAGRGNAMGSMVESIMTSMIKKDKGGDRHGL